jgi:hypothetical protein
VSGSDSIVIRGNARASTDTTLHSSAIVVVLVVDESYLVRVE